MNNKQALKYWGNLSKTQISQDSSKVNKINNHSAEDAEFIMQFANQNSDILDLAAGTGGALNLYYDKVHSITAVEKFKEFSKLIVKADNVEVINADIKEFSTTKKFDFVVLFGVMHYFSEYESKQIYEKCKNFLVDGGGGTLLIKQQFGVKEDVFVEYSNELKQEYFSVYRHIDKEKEILRSIGFNKIEQYDIYDKQANRFDNTHFWALMVSLG